jgi:hypothetical protein
MTALTKRERVLRTIRFEETDRTPLYDLLMNDAIIEHYAGQRLTVANGHRVKGKAIGRVLDMTRMPDGPARPRLERQANGIELQVERWTSWISTRPWSDMGGLVEWIRGEIRRAKGEVYDRAYAERLHARIRRRQEHFASGDPTGRNDPAVLILESGAACPRCTGTRVWKISPT